MKDLGVLHWFLGTEFKCSNNEIEISQTRYIRKLLARFGMEYCKPKSTPSVLGLDTIIDANSPELDDSNLCRQIVGSLIYVMTGTRPDLCYIVTKLSQYMSKPTETHLNAAKYVLRYLKGTLDRSLKFRKSESPLELIGFSDSDWGPTSEIGRAFLVTVSSYLSMDHWYLGKVKSSKPWLCLHARQNILHLLEQCKKVSI